MKVTVEIPDELYRRVKARSALLGKAVREVTIDLYERWLAGDATAASPDESAQWLSDWLHDADAAMRAAPADTTARAALQQDRDRTGTSRSTGCCS